MLGEDVLHTESRKNRTAHDVVGSSGKLFYRLEQQDDLAGNAVLVRAENCVRAKQDRGVNIIATIVHDPIDLRTGYVVFGFSFFASSGRASISARSATTGPASAVEDGNSGCWCRA